MRANPEMGYLFEEPLVVDNAKITTRLGSRATPIEEALEHTARARDVSVA